jgi:YidC/Oxa1 family membrane protein insertase
LGQQAYIVRYHPHTPVVAPVVGEVGKTLAPKPGQRPVRTTKASSASSPAASAASSADAVEAAPATETASTPAGSSASRGSATPRPGQRPNRPGGNRPPAKRPSKAKKRR